jgi:hypothetical protein
VSERACLRDAVRQVLRNKNKARANLNFVFLKTHTRSHSVFVAGTDESSNFDLLKDLIKVVDFVGFMFIFPELAGV